MKDVLSKIAVTLLKIILLLIFIAFLAKSNNMPAAVPKEYVEKIVELTDRFLIAVNLITDKRIIAKYKKKSSKKGNISDNIIEEDSGYNSNLVVDWLFYNGYNRVNEEKLFKIYNKVEHYIISKEEELKSLSNSSLLANYFEKKELKMDDKRFLHLFELSIKNLKYISSVLIIQKSNFTYRIGSSKFAVGDLKKIKDNSIMWNNETPYYIYKKYNAKYKYFIYFVINLKKIFFNMGDNVFVISKKNKVIYSQNKNINFIKAVEKNNSNDSFKIENKSYVLIKKYFDKLDVYITLVYEEYPFIKFLLNLFKILAMIFFIVGIYICGKNFYGKFKELRKLKKQDELTIVSETMEEISKSIKLATESTERIIETYSKKDSDKDYRELYTLIEKKMASVENIPKEKKRDDEWKLIEPY